MHTALIVEDNLQAHDYLLSLLSGSPFVKVIGKAENVREAVEFIVQFKPDLLFLDVELGCQTGFDVLHEIKHLNLHPAVIFTTAWEKYAINAIRHAAFDYLLKPIDPAELEKALLRLEQGMIQGKQDNLDSLFTFLKSGKKIQFHIRNGTIFIDPNDLFYCEADGNYSQLFLTDHRKEFVTCQLGQVEELLKDMEFIRLGRSFLLNRKLISRIDRTHKQVHFEKGGSIYILELSQRQIRDLNELLAE